MAALDGGWFAISGRLIDHVDFPLDLLPGCQGLGVGKFESIEAATFQERHLIPDDVTSGAKFTGIAIPFPQDPRRRKTAAIPEAGEIYRHQGKLRQVNFHGFRQRITFEDDA
jgi:hypothetical protein